MNRDPVQRLKNLCDAIHFPGVGQDSGGMLAYWNKSLKQVFSVLFWKETFYSTNDFNRLLEAPRATEEARKVVWIPLYTFVLTLFSANKGKL